jgi:hypothetical protein
MKTKKALLFLLIVTFCSCKRQNDITPTKSNAPVKGGKLKTQSGGDGQWDLLGYGLDVTGDIHDINSVSDAPIFDMARFATDYRSRLDVNGATAGDTKYYYGVTALDYLKDVTKSLALNADYTTNPKIEGVKSDDSTTTLFTGSLGINNSDQSRAAYTSRYSYMTYEAWQRVNRIRFTGDVSVDLLMQYLTPEFINNVATMSADALVARYGTHIMLDISIGGALHVNYTGSLLTENNSDTKKSDLKIGLGVGVLNTIGVNVNFDKSQTEITQVTQTTLDRQYSIKFYGGTNTGTSITIDKDGNASETVNSASWQQSITTANAALIGVDNALYLYDFIADPVKKALVKTAVENYIAAHQIKLAPQEVYEFSTPILGRHAYNLDQLMYQKYLSDGWHSNGQPFKAYSIPYNNAVPIYQFYNAQLNDRVLTAVASHPSWGADWYNGGLLFYAYATNVAGTVPIYSFRNQAGNDHYYSTKSTPYDGSWINEGISLYAFAN